MKYITLCERMCWRMKRHICRVHSVFILDEAREYVYERATLVSISLCLRSMLGIHPKRLSNTDIMCLPLTHSTAPADAARLIFKMQLVFFFLFVSTLCSERCATIFARRLVEPIYYIYLHLTYLHLMYLFLFLSFSSIFFFFFCIHRSVTSIQSAEHRA